MWMIGKLVSGRVVIGDGLKLKDIGEMGEWEKIEGERVRS